LLKIAERGAIRKDDRVAAAEFRWLMGEWEQAARHLDLAGRDFFRTKDPASRLVTQALEKVARSKASK
jgi:hypothetical protein